MAVFTSVTRGEVGDWLTQYSIGTLQDMQGILHGIENTNYFVTTSDGDFVLTIFEVLKPHELPFYLNFMAHLAHHGIPCPRPVANLRDYYLGELRSKPAGVVTKLAGKSNKDPEPIHCQKVGAMLAKMHLAGQTYPPTAGNPRDLVWCKSAAERVRPFLDDAAAALLADELVFQTTQRPNGLPHGVVHGDLFRDNVLFNDERLTGVIDFYFAGADDWLFDLAVTVNDWCMDEQGFDTERLRGLLGSYQEIRSVGDPEKRAWATLLRAAALRFWLSRLVDYHLPRRGEMVIPHDPDRFRTLLEIHRLSRPQWPL
jgi:homoserine kinase type II